MKCLILICILAIMGLSCSQSKNKEAGEILHLSEDGSWGYAGRHAYIADNKLFYSYLDQAGNTWVASCDFKSGEIARTNIWEGANDMHSSNPLLIRPDGRVQVFLDKGDYLNKRISWKVSKEPWSVSEFGELQESELEADITQGRQFYPVVHEATGEVYLFINALRDNYLRETVMWKSPDGGDTWTEYHNLWGLGKGLEGNRCYTRVYIEGDEIHFATLRVGWNEPLAGQKIGKVEGVYYTKYNVRQNSFFHANGTRAFGIGDVPVYDTNYFDEIWNWEKDGNKRQRAMWSDIVADKSGRPYLTFTVQDAVPQGESALHDGYWAMLDGNGNWMHHKVATLARGWDNKPERKNYAIAIDPGNPATVYVSASTSREEDLSQVQRLQTFDNGKTWQSSGILSKEGRITTVVVPRVLDHSDKIVEVLWLDGRMAEWRDYETKIYAWRKK
jgi:hypothetical protein